MFCFLFCFLDNFFLFIIIIYFPENKRSIQRCKSLLILSSMLVVLRALWLCWFSIKSFLSLNNVKYSTVFPFCLFTFFENMCSPSVTSLVLKLFARTLHFSRCCWSSSSSAHSEHSRLVCKYFCL